MDKDEDLVLVVSYYLSLDPITFYPRPPFPIPTLVCAPGNVLKIANTPRDDTEAREFYLFIFFILWSHRDKWDRAYCS